MQFKSHRKVIIALIALAVGMFAFGFALVPLYNHICKAFGVNGKPNLTVEAYDVKHAKIDKTRWVQVQFVATQNTTLPWKFYPEVKTVTIHPGEMAKLAFYAENQSDHTMVVQAIPSVTPGVAAQYVKKTECFCFTQQTLNAHEAMHMPLLFHLDVNLPKTVTTMTLAYTLFDVTNRVKGTGVKP